MFFDPDNNINKLCASGMLAEGEGNGEKAAQLFLQAWNEAITPMEKFTAAHYVARHQPTVADKLKWDQVALANALEAGEEARPAYSSLYLNIARCYEDMNDREKAGRYYQLALEHIGSLPEDGYGNMIRSGIHKGIERIGEP